MTGELLLLLAAHLVLTGLPAAAAILFAARRGVDQIPILLAIGLAVSGAVAMLAFWAYLADPLLGESVSFLIAFGSVLACGACLYAGVDRRLLRQLAVPLGLWALGSAFLLLFGFVHGGAATPLLTAGSRFSGALPTDSRIPRFYSEWFFQHGGSPRPPVYPGEWHFSDRPPLQVGYALTQRAFGWDRNGLNYQVLAVALQQLWIVGLWALLLAARVGRLTRALVMSAVLVSYLAILNGFYVWPKLLPAAMLLAAAAILITPLWSQLRHNLWAAALVAGLCALAMLGHGSSAFGIIPLAIVAAWRGLPSWRWLGVAVATAVVLLGSWSAYQKWGDPPGNRLTKWTLAGAIEIDDRGLLETLGDAYGEAGVDGVLEDKQANLETMLGLEPTRETFEKVFDGEDSAEVLRAVRNLSFFYLLPSLALFLLAPVLIAVMAVLRRLPADRAELRFALLCLGVFLLGTVIWGLLVFGSDGDTTLIQIISYLLPVLAMTGCVIGLRAVLPRFAVVYVALASLLSLALCAPALDPQPGTSYSAFSALGALAALGSFLLIALRSEGGRRRAQAKTELIRSRPWRRFGLP